MVLGPFAETKGPRLPGRNPASQKISGTQYLITKYAMLQLPKVFKYKSDGFWIENVENDGGGE
jgi:hypothetical protein